MSQALHLLRLQKVDSQRDQATARIKAIDRILAGSEPLVKARQEEAAAGKTLDSARAQLQIAEQNVAAQTIKIEQVEASLYGGRVHNPKELQDLHNELSSLKRYLSTLEDRQLEAMVVYEEAESAVTGASRQVQVIEAEVAQQHSELGIERERRTRELSRLEAERHGILSNVTPSNLQVYEKLRSLRGGRAVAEISDSSCSACGSPITPAEWQASRSPGQVSFCPTCGRILYGG